MARENDGADGEVSEVSKDLRSHRPSRGKLLPIGAKSNGPCSTFVTEEDGQIGQAPQADLAIVPAEASC